MLIYPHTRKDQAVDEYFGQSVSDPYRWLEDDLSAETERWVAEQNRVTFDYLDQIAYREQLKQRLTTMWDFPKETAPTAAGDYEYFSRNDGLQNQYAIYRRHIKDGSEELFLDPNTFSNDGTTSLSVLEFSEDGRRAAYAISEGGSDWRKIFVIDTDTKKQLEPPLVDVKFSGISWLGNDGFYYSKYEKPEGSELSAKTDQHLLFYHQLGTAQSDDTLVFGNTLEQKRRYVHGHTTEDNRYLVITGAQATSGNDLYIQDLNSDDKALIQIAEQFDADIDVVAAEGDWIFAITDKDAPNKRLVKFSLAAPLDWLDVIPETSEVLSITTGGGYFFGHYLVDATSKVIQFDQTGQVIRVINLPDLGTATFSPAKRNAETIYYSFSNYHVPPTIYAFNVRTGESQVHRTLKSKFASSDYQSTQVFFESRDGTRVPMIITHKKSLELNGKNPTILYGYGGFNISLTPNFSIAFSVWLELGGVLAIPNLRGGGEYGKDWHKAGTLTSKQNVFDDFIAAGGYLCDQGYTSTDYLALHGGSNGGLLVGAVMTQRPDLAKVALPAVGVLDMLRYHTFTAGAGWAYDYGTSEQSPEMFAYLLDYSPLHNIKQDVSYPATMVTTADHDDRVVPAHSFKFAAELQAKAAKSNPALIRIDSNAGHGLGTPVSMVIERYADQFSFALYNMGFEQLPDVS